MRKIKPEVLEMLQRCGLVTTDDAMEAHIGKRIVYANWEPMMGTVTRDHTFTIIGVQLTHTGEKAYRVVCNGFDDTFGRVARPADIIMLTEKESHNG